MRRDDEDFSLNQKLIRQLIMNQMGEEAAASTPSYSAPKSKGSGGVTDLMGERGELSPEELRYIVNITREDLPDLNPLTGKPKGWKKTVERFALRPGEMPPSMSPAKKKVRA